MTSKQPDLPDRSQPETAVSPPERALTPAARRALAEAQARRALADAEMAASSPAKEIDGRGGLEPVRYRDWEVKGLASDF